MMQQIIDGWPNDKVMSGKGPGFRMELLWSEQGPLVPDRCLYAIISLGSHILFPPTDHTQNQNQN